MPKIPSDYSKACIYKLCCKDPNIKDIYIGSTTNFTKRKSGHKTCCNNPEQKQNHSYVYKFIRDNENWENWSMIEIEKVQVQDKRELEMKEREYIEKYKATLNKFIPCRTPQEYYKANKTRVLQKHKQLRKKKTERIEKLEKLLKENNITID